MITGHAELLCIVADPIAHLRTPEIFNDHLAGVGVDAVVVPVHARPDTLRTVVDGLRLMQNLRAIIVTVPRKIAIVALFPTLPRRTPTTVPPTAISPPMQHRSA